MLSKEDQRRFDEITHQLRVTDPEFVARLGDRGKFRRARLILVLTFVLWATVPALVVLGGWLAVAVAPAVLVAATLMMWQARRVR
ncbi:DUF3040 domain-containing protein [Plantactinospora sp. WMMB334]|uniref:DUF3040 domain-containing protein n=1 Tax=Plantactinospora sp. WMMB334 TaxID=3404119 RepID=UPI003B952281